MSSLGISKTLGLLHHQTDGSSLYQHLCETLSRLQEAENPYQSFEMLSTYVRDVRLPKTAGADLEVPDVDPRAPARTDWADKTKALGKGTPADAQLGDVADFWAQSRMLRAAGLGFSDDECYTLALSIRNLAYKHKAVSGRFWGKILGTENDYYVTELELTGADSVNHGDVMEQHRADYVEPRGTGVNQHVYFVCTSITAEWLQLPNAVPAQIQRSRAISKMFTGKLDTPIWSHPPFPWTEQELLRSMIARITHATTIAPEGYYKIEGEEGAAKVVKNPGFAPDAEAPTDPTKWVYARAYLRLNGRVTFPAPLEGELDAEMEQINKHLEQDAEKDAETAGARSGAPQVPSVLTSVKDDIDDQVGKSKPSPWLVVGGEEARFRKLGDGATYNFPDPKGPKTYAVVLVESLRFPGAYAVAQGDKHCNVYVGYGLKKQRAFLPLAADMAPGPILTEPDDLPELIEDNNMGGDDDLGEEEGADEDEDP